MRLAVSLLTCVAVSVLTPALADPAPNEPSANTTTHASPAPASATPAAPAAATPAPAATPAAAHPAASAAPTTTVSPGVDVEAAQMDQLEKHFLAEGYKIEMHSGEKYYCRREEQLGSRLGGQKHCSTAQQLEYTEKDSQRQATEALHQQASSPK